jgi:hypothetical protein
VNNDAVPVTITIFVEETNKHYSQYLDTPDNDDRCFKLSGVSVQVMYVTGHNYAGWA